jgi:hypothetical protein
VLDERPFVNGEEFNSCGGKVKALNARPNAVPGHKPLKCHQSDAGRVNAATGNGLQIIPRLQMRAAQNGLIRVEQYVCVFRENWCSHWY